jgi:N-acetylglutamate synthase-like GNAT family acetyltransferase
MRLRPARVDELAHLSALCLRSKAVWGYNDAFLKACRAELTLTPQDLQETHVSVAEIDGNVLGVAQVSCDGAEAVLEKLFVEPDQLLAGAGARLFSWAVGKARELGAKSMVIDADPGAAAFYRRMGARDDGVAKSESIPGRTLPRLRLDI